jgi:hypothetical protein
MSDLVEWNGRFELSENTLLELLRLAAREGYELGEAQGRGAVLLSARNVLEVNAPHAVYAFEEAKIPPREPRPEHLQETAKNVFDAVKAALVKRGATPEAPVLVDTDGRRLA